MRGIRKPAELRSKLQLMAILGAVILGMYLLKAGCIIKRIIGVDCPGCGMTRAALSLLQGDIAGAFAYHGMVWSLPLLLLLFLYDGKLFRSRGLNAALWTVLGVGFAVNWLVKVL